MSFITWIGIISILFCVAIGFDISPYLRGPSYYPPEWRWEYLFINTLPRMYMPLAVIALIFGLYFWIDAKKKLTVQQLWVSIVALIMLFFCFQLSMLFFSRAGVAVLIHRIINPEINGYFTAALSIQSVPEFLRTYNTIMLDFVYHAKAHPPGAILLFYYLNQFVSLIPQFGVVASTQMSNRPDVREIWETLSASWKATVFVASLFIPFLSALSIIPLYYTAKLLYGTKAAMRSTFLFLFIPSLLFFIPINDAFLHIFSLSAFCFFAYGLKKDRGLLLFIAGFIQFLGIFFNLSLLPVLVLFFVYFLLYEYKNIKKQFSAVFRKGSMFLLGLVIPLLLLFFFFQFNFIQVTQTIMHYVPDVHTRSYTIWIFYNLYDFFVFTGIPVAILYFAVVKQAVIASLKGVAIPLSMSLPRFARKDVELDPLVIAFTVMLLIVNFSGSIRAETGRIWIPFIPFVVLIASGFLTNNLKFSSKTFAIILALQALQLLVMQEFWVMLW